MPADLRERLIVAAEEPLLGPDTGEILRRAGRRRRRAWAVVVTGAACIVATAALVVTQASLFRSDDAAVVTGFAGRSPVLDIERTPSEVIVGLVEQPTDPAVVERELRAAGIDATVEAQPASPAAVGQWLTVGFDYPPESGRPDPGGLPETPRIDPDDASVIHFPRPASGSYRLGYGRPASPGEPWHDLRP